MPQHANQTSFKPGHQLRTPEVIKKWRATMQARHGRLGFERGVPNVRLLTRRTDYFHTIDTPSKAYVLGFIYADGCVYSNGHVMGIGLQPGDVEILEFIRAELQSMCVIRPDAKGTLRLEIGSHEIIRDLASHGVTPRKSLTLEWPTTVPPELLSAFVHGYFDGDGTVFWTRMAQVREGRYPGASFMASWAFAGPLAEYLRSCAVAARPPVAHSKRVPHIARVQIYGSAVPSLGRLLYAAAPAGLQRKRAVFTQIAQYYAQR